MASEKVVVNSTKVSAGHGAGGGLFLVTYIGALVYFLNVSYGFWPTVWAFFKALVWPGFVVYHVLTLLHA